MWRSIPSFPGYAISDNGQIKSFQRSKTGILLKPEKTRNGYLRVSLSNKDGKFHKSVHRLVAQIFIPNTYHKPMINHIDGDKENNSVNNLEWVTNSENQLHGFRVLKRKMGGMERKPVKCVETGMYYPNLHAAAKAISGSPGHICQCCKGQRKMCAGYHWEYVTN